MVDVGKLLTLLLGGFEWVALIMPVSDEFYLVSIKKNSIFVRFNSARKQLN